ncbi:MAG: alkaline phosphatase family protein, partial [Thermoleophilaceae bacterium]|nr:alkaline phosphatase family protein [Thermoleophilaceae bacterium]
MPSLVLGPMLRYVGEQTAVVWVETDRPCEVGVLSATAPTFHVEGHHYALVRIAGLEPGTPHEYEVMLDGERAWPPEDSEYPPSVIRTYPRDGELRVAFGSCRLTVPHEPPYSLPRDEDERARETDALYALAARMRSEPNDRWPQLLLMLGDQVYADEVSPETARYIERTRDTDQP